MGTIRIEEKRLIFERKDELTVLEPYGAHCIRCRSTKNASILDENWTVLPAASPDECIIEGDEKTAWIRNGRMSACIQAGNPW